MTTTSNSTVKLLVRRTGTGWPLVDAAFPASVCALAGTAGSEKAARKIAAALRKALIVVVGAVSILTYGRLTVSSHSNDDWRSAMEFVRKEAGSAPVLLVSPFAEATDFTNATIGRIAPPL